MERGRDLVEQPALAHRLRQTPDQRIGRVIAAGPVRREHQGAAAHEPTASATSSAVGSSRPVMKVRGSLRPTSRW